MTRLSWMTLMVLVLMSTAGSAVWADGPTPGQPASPNATKPETTVRVKSGPDGVTIYMGFTATFPGHADQGQSPGTAQSSSAPSCSASMVNPLHSTPVGWTTYGAVMSWYQAGLSDHPDNAPWSVQCSNGYVGIVWLPINAAAPAIVTVPAASLDPATIAAELVDHLPVPGSEIGTSPALGLVAVPSWFWAEGYDGSPIVTSETLGNTTVEVELVPERYRWGFGDGASMETRSLGQRYPQVSDIQHVYEQSSFSAGGAYTVSLLITFSAHYRVNGGPWLELEPVTRTMSSAYLVQQVQAVLGVP
jgi:hypothetical protein